MTRGRKPKPTALKLVAGNPGKRALPKKEAKPPESRSTPPAHLSQPARAEWRRVVAALTRVGLMTTLDRAPLAAYCQAYGRWVQAETALARIAEKDPAMHGLLTKTSKGSAIQSPLVGVANKAAADMVRYASEFGMTPAARARVDAGPLGAGDGETEDEGERFFR